MRGCGAIYSVWMVRMESEVLEMDDDVRRGYVVPEKWSCLGYEIMRFRLLVLRYLWYVMPRYGKVRSFT